MLALAFVAAAVHSSMRTKTMGKSAATVGNRVADEGGARGERTGGGCRMVKGE